MTLPRTCIPEDLISRFIINILFHRQIGALKLHHPCPYWRGVGRHEARMGETTVSHTMRAAGPALHPGVCGHRQPGAHRQVAQERQGSRTWHQVIVAF